MYGLTTHKKDKDENPLEALTKHWVLKNYRCFSCRVFPTGMGSTDMFSDR